MTQPIWLLAFIVGMIDEYKVNGVHRSAGARELYEPEAAARTVYHKYEHNRRIRRDHKRVGTL